MRPTQRSNHRRQGGEGATSVEYAFVAVLIAIVVVGSVRLVGGVTQDNICSPTQTFSEAMDAAGC